MNLLIPLAISVSLAGTAPPPDVVKMDMRIDSPDRDVGKTMRLFVSVDLKDGWTGNAGKAPNFILQVDAPDCVEMQGPRLEGIRNLSRNGFLRPPEEKMMEGRETSLEFKITKAPSKDDRFAVNLIGYVTDADNTDVWYIRRRMAFAMTKDAKPTRIDESPSTWGIGNELELGDKAVPFKLPQADGTEVDLSQYLGKKNIIVSTYRAFW